MSTTQLENQISMMCRNALEHATLEHTCNVGYVLYRCTETGKYILHYIKEVKKAMSTNAMLAIKKLVNEMKDSHIDFEYQASTREFKPYSDESKFTEISKLIVR